MRDTACISRTSPACTATTCTAAPHRRPSQIPCSQRALELRSWPPGGTKSCTSSPNSRLSSRH
eukprot:1270738-Alexandrium_andersonii.AAC.1